ncbi:hypothetical protein COE25_19150 [Bacillus sp. AFS031507]|nr:hypothetical protein COE25_19150 [Bacillus sp. AFS031507]
MLSNSKNEQAKPPVTRQRVLLCLPYSIPFMHSPFNSFHTKKEITKGDKIYMKRQLLAGLGIGAALLFSIPVSAQTNVIQPEDFTYGDKLGAVQSPGYNVGFSVVPEQLKEQDIQRITVQLVGTDGKVVAENEAKGKGLKNLIAYDGQQYSTQFYGKVKKMKDDVWTHSIYCGQKPAFAEIIVQDKRGNTYKAHNTNAPNKELDPVPNCPKGQ